MLWWIWIAGTFLLQRSTGSPQLEVASAIRGEILESDPVVVTETLREEYTDGPTRGRSYEIRVREPGSYRIELRSYFFDAYLVLRDDTGEVLQEDDDGLLRTHAGIVVDSLAPGREYRVDACALHGRTGEFELRMVRSESSQLSPEERRAAALADAREAIRVVEAAKGPKDPLLARRLDELARLIWQEGDFGKAVPLLERALRINEEALGVEDRTTAGTLNNMGILYQAMGRYEEATRCLERALEICEKVLGPEHPTTGGALRRLGLLLEARGNHERAKELLARASSVSRASPQREDDEVFLDLTAKAYLLQTEGDYNGAEALFERALTICEGTLGLEHPYTAAALNNLGMLHFERGDYRKARRRLDQALEGATRIHGPRHPTTATVLSNRANLDYAEGDFAGARSALSRAYEIHREFLGPEHPQTIVTLNNLTATLLAMGASGEAKEHLADALEATEKTLGAEHPRAAFFLNNLGMAHQADGEYTEARRCFERALSIFEKEHGSRHWSVALVRNSLGVVLLYLGEDEKAAVLLKAALESYEASLGLEHPLAAQVLNNLAALEHARGNSHQALALYRKALDVFEENIDPGHPWTAMIRKNMASTLYDLGKPADAWQLLREALASTQSHLDASLWSLTESERLQWVDQQGWSLALLLSLSREKPSSEAAESAFEALVWWKGQVYRAGYESRERVRHRLTPQAAEQLERLRVIQSQIAKAFYGYRWCTGAEELRDHESLLSRLRGQRSRLEEELLRLARPASDARAVSLRRVRAALPAASALVDFLVHPWYEPALRQDGKIVRSGRWTEPHLSAWILRARDAEPVLVDLGPVGPIRQAVETFLADLASLGETPLVQIDASSPIEKASTPLRRLLWEPIRPHLQEEEMLFVSPDSFLGMLPFEVIRLEDGSYLIEHHAFVYVQDVASLARIASGAVRKGRDSNDLLLIGAVDYDSRDDIDVGAEVAAPSPRNGSPLLSEEIRRGFSSSWPALPGTRVEVLAIADLHKMTFARDRRRLVLSGSAATEDRVSEELPRFHIAHIATHGFFQPEGLPAMWEGPRDTTARHPEMLIEARRSTGSLPGLLSGLVLAGANLPPRQGSHDGYLTAEEISWLDLSGVELVVLSACETGLGSPRGGEGMLGLRRTVRQAGATTVITSLWTVRDRSTSELMRRMYERLWQGGEGRLEALRGAQLDILNANRRNYGGNARPWTWGAFVLDGDWR